MCPLSISREPLIKFRKLRACGARPDKARLAGNVGHLVKRCNAGRACATGSRRALTTGSVSCVALFGKVAYIPCRARLVTKPVVNAEQTKLNQRFPGYCDEG